MEIIAGIEGNRAPVIAEALRLGAPVMLSANSFWNEEAGRFSPSWKKCAALRIHLDSGGYVAMKKYGRFRFGVEDYCRLAAEMRPEWFAQMDLCCEPDVASNRSEVFRRIEKTAENLRECRAVAAEVGAQAPLIVLQGWKPQDYVSGPAFDDPNFEWPAVVGVGSVCRRHLHGPDGLLAVIGRLDAKLPPHVRLHLFGVKSQGAELLRHHPRIASVDSMAHSYGARVEAREEKKPCNNRLRAEHFTAWVERQRARTGGGNELLLNL